MVNARCVWKETASHENRDPPNGLLHASDCNADAERVEVGIDQHQHGSTPSEELQPTIIPRRFRRGRRYQLNPNAPESGARYRIMNNTESTIICSGCDAPFLPSVGDLCPRCEQRNQDRLTGGKVACWMLLGVAVALWIGLKICAGAENFPGNKPGVKGGSHEVIQKAVPSHTVGAPVVATTGASCVTDALLDRIAWIESRGNPKAIGQLGEIGIFQLRPIAIREVNRIHNTRFTVADARRPRTSRRIARLYLRICERRVSNPTPERVYAKYRGAR